jgi:tRNA G18 (ribose-2'-O)-methylase SpoU
LLQPNATIIVAASRQRRSTSIAPFLSRALACHAKRRRKTYGSWMSLPPVEVRAPDDPRLADYRQLKERHLNAEGGRFVAESERVVRRLVASGLTVRSVLLTPPRLATLADALTGPFPVYLAEQAVLDAIAGFHVHRGCLAIGERPPANAWRALAAAARRLVIVERVGDASNIGSIFRNAAALGADAVLLGPACADPLYRKSIRTSMAAALVVPFAAPEPWPDALRELGTMGFATIALTPAATATTLRDLVRDAAVGRAARGLGHEGFGRTPGALEACTRRARIPMAADADSLNVATAAAIALYELAR